MKFDLSLARLNETDGLNGIDDSIDDSIDGNIESFMQFAYFVFFDDLSFIADKFWPHRNSH
jgi:hypothetical protein